MAAVLEKNEAAAKHGSQVEEQLAQATSRIRAHDLTFGGLVLVAFVLMYATAMILLDKYLNLPEWIRQLSLAGFGVLFAGTAYLTIFSPLRKRINPLYAAKQVERTIDDAKNSVTGYVDAQLKGDLNPTVKAALASKAAKAAAEADVNRAVDHRSLVYLGGVSIVFLLTLIVLFFVFRPAQFTSLMGRAFVPFNNAVRENQTQLELAKPDPLDPTITTGQTVVVAVHVKGKVPKADAADKVRLLVRHNLNDPNYEELPMVQGATSRDWELRVPDYLVQNGFWYKVAGGDAVTEEHKVTVRSLPLFTEFQATYEYPKYMRRKNDTANDPVIRGYRGTSVTLVARANREVRDGLMEIQPGNVRVPGVLVAGKPDSLQFAFKLADAGKYKLTFNATNGERSADAFQSTITLDSDLPPVLTILDPAVKPEDMKPEEGKPEEISTLPLNGQIVIDGRIGDDFGIDTVTLKMKIVEPARLHRELQPVPYLNGKSPSFLRESDKTYPTNLDYKGSVDLAKLKKDAANLDVTLEPGMVIEYWLEATDNCTEPKANVGKSAPKRVRLEAPKTEPMEQKNLDQQKEQRRNDEQKFNEKQQDKLAKENRDPKKGDNQPGKPDVAPEPKQGNKGNTPDAKTDPKKGPNDPAEPKNPPNDPNMTGEKPNDPKMGGMPGDMTKPPAGDMPKGGDPKPGDPKGSPEPKGGEPDPNVAKTADEIQKELDRQNRSAGEGKSNPSANPEERADPAQPKPQPPGGGTNGASETKSEPKQPNPNDPANKGAAPAESKPQGEMKKGDDPGTTKPQPAGGNPMDPKQAPAESRNAPPEVGGGIGGDKEQPTKPQPMPMDPDKKQDPTSGATGKGATEKKDTGTANATDKTDPAAGAASGPKPPVKDPTPGDEKAKPPQPKETNPADPKGAPDATGGDAKPEKAAPAGTAKTAPKDDMKGGMAETKPDGGANNGAAQAQPKPDDKSAPMAGGDKPPPQADNKGMTGTGGEKKLDPKQAENLKQAAKDLAGDDEGKKQDARDTLDKTVGKEKRQELEQAIKDAKSDDKATKDAGQQKLDQFNKELEGKKDEKGAQGGAGQRQLDAKTKQEKREIENAANDLADNDPAKQQAARDKLDKMIGEQNRKEIEQTIKDLNSDDPQKRAAAREKIEKAKQQAEDKARQEGKQPTPEDLQAQKDFEKEVQDALKDLRGNDEAKKQAARDKLDKMVGRDVRERAEDIFKDLDSKDPEKQKRGQEKLEKWRDENELKDLEKKAKDLQAKDEKTREQAKKDLDDKFGEEERKKLEEQLKDKKMDPEQLKKELDEWRQGLGRSAPLEKPMEADPKKRLHAAELQLETFADQKNRQAIKDKMKWTDQEVDKFIKDYEKYVKDLRDEVNKPVTEAPMPTDPALTPGGANSKVDRTPGKSPDATGTGPTARPPGFEDAAKKFLDALKNEAMKKK